MKYLVGVLALAAVCAAEPEADPVYALYSPYYLRPYAASGYAGPLPGASYQAVHRLHRREADADPQLLLNSFPAVSPLLSTPVVSAPVVSAPVLAAAHAVADVPVVKSVVEAPAVVSHTVHATPLTYAAAAPLPLAAHLPLAAAPAVSVAAAPLSTAVVGLNARDCVTEGGCALKAALSTGLPAATFGATTVVGRKRRDAEADAEAEAEADPALFYNNFYGYPYAYNALPYAYNAYPYAAPAFPYSYNPYVAAAPAVVAAPEVAAAPAVVAAEAPVVAASAAPVVAASAPVVAASVPYVAAPLAAPAPVVAARAPVVHNVAKQVTYTHLGAHPIAPTTVVETESRLVL